jgi:hypothetical protein
VTLLVTMMAAAMMLLKVQAILTTRQSLDHPF